MRAAALLLLVTVLSSCGEGGPSAEAVAAERAAVAADRAARNAAAPPAVVSASQTALAAGQQVAARSRGPSLSCPAMAEGPHGSTYRAEALPPGPARILSMRTIPADGGGGCNIEVGYPGAERAFVMSPHYSCEEERPRIYSVAEIRQLGQLDDLPPEDRADIERLEDIGVVGVEGEFTWTLYVPNRTCSVRTVELSD